MNTERLYHVAVYGTLMTGCRNYRWAADALARESCLIQGTLYDTGCGFPAFVPGETQWHDGELLLVNQETLNRMDRLEGYPHLYTRKTIKAYTATAGWQDAYVYVMHRLPNSAQVMTHSWLERRGTHEMLMRRMAEETDGVGNGDTKTMFIAEDTKEKRTETRCDAIYSPDANDTTCAPNAQCWQRQGARRPPWRIGRPPRRENRFSVAIFERLGRGKRLEAVAKLVGFLRGMASDD